MDTSAEATNLKAYKSTDVEIIDLGATLGSLWRGKWLIAFVTFLAIAIGTYYAYFAVTPLYRATAVVILDTQKEQVVDLQAAMTSLSSDSSVVNSEVEVLRARGLMGKVVDRLDLTIDPEFNGALRTPDLIHRFKQGIHTVLGTGGKSGPTPRAELRTRDYTVSALLGKISISNVPNSLVFNVTTQTENAEKSALIADTIAELYILNQIEVKFAATEQATGWLTSRVAELQSELEVAEAKAKSFSTGTALISPETLQGLEVQLKELRDRIATAQVASNGATDRASALRSAVTPQDKLGLTDDAILARIFKGDGAPAAEFEDRFSQITARADLEEARATRQLTALLQSQSELELQISQQSKDLITLQQFSREAEASRLLYEYFLTRLKETSAQQGVQQADSRILSAAVVPGAPAVPRKSMILLMALVLGLMLGAAIVLLREARNNAFRSARDVEEFTGYTVMGQIPLIPAQRRQSTIDYLMQKPTSAAAEAVRNLRTSILLSNVDKPPQVILTTSSVPHEGKTTTSLALAQNFVGTGKKVLLIEGDIRRNVFAEYFKDAPSKGLVSLMMRDVSLEEVLYHDERLGLDLLFGERTHTSAADLFSSEAFRTLIDEMRARYDVIIIDTPPVLVVPDARIIASVVDTVLFVIKWDSSPRGQIEDALRMFESVDQKVTGVVLAQVDPKGMKRYGYGGEYGSYGGLREAYYAN
ncbi:MAG: capsular exopolysaccharide synthesis family protein [Halocynthiibacter sp.]|jgi:succinoglycan biosynthesis transport protein ExoP